MEATLYKLNTNSFNLDSLIEKLKEVNTFLSIFDKKVNPFLGFNTTKFRIN